jgi:hypothetical protein
MQDALVLNLTEKTDKFSWGSAFCWSSRDRTICIVRLVTSIYMRLAIRSALLCYNFLAGNGFSSGGLT